MGAKKGITLNTKKLKNYFNQKTFLGVTLVGALLLVILYVFVYLEYTEKTEALEASNRELTATVNELEEYNRNMEQYKVEIEEIKAEADSILAEYPADTREEDAIMLAVQLQRKNAIAYDAVNMEEKEGVYTVEADLVNAAEIEGLDESLVFARKHAVYVNTTTYADLKSVIEQIYASDNRIGIDNIVYSKDEETGTLEGNIDIYFYCVAGTDKEYEAPDIASYLAGTDDLFKSESNAKARAALEEAEADEAEDGAEENVE